MKALESRNMEAYYASTKEEAVQKALELMEEGSSVTMGGSMSVRESGLLDAINAGNYEFYDRDQAATPEERQEIALKAFTCDWYLGSVNAMSENEYLLILTEMRTVWRHMRSDRKTYCLS